MNNSNISSGAKRLSPVPKHSQNVISFEICRLISALFKLLPPHYQTGQLLFLLNFSISVSNLLWIETENLKLFRIFCKIRAIGSETVKSILANPEYFLIKKKKSF